MCAFVLMRASCPGRLEAGNGGSLDADGDDALPGQTVRHIGVDAECAGAAPCSFRLGLCGGTG